MAASDWHDEDIDRALTDREDRREWENLGERIILFLLGAGVIIAVLFWGASWLDGQFGWNLTGGLKDLIGGILASFKTPA
jgi:hypothetical protein